MKLSNLPPGVTDSMIERQAGYVRYEVVESKVWQHKETGRKVSPYGACPWMSDAEKDSWELVSQGWTIRDNHFNTVGMGRVPWKTQAEAQAQADAWNA